MAEYIAEAIEIAEQLCYPSEIKYELQSCKTEIQVDNILAKYRKEK